MGQYTNQDCLTEIEKISTVKANIRNAIIEKGVEVPADTVFADYSEKIADISGSKPEENLTQTITENGHHVCNPSEGQVFNSASITGDVPDPVLGTLNVTPTKSEQNITAQTEGYAGYSEVNVSAVTSSIDSNITAENIKKDVTILGVTGTLESGGKDYRYKNGTPDVEGLTAIGWTTDDIEYYGANTPSHYAWENNNYKMSQENIDLYSQNDPKPSLYKNNKNVTFVPNKNMSRYFSTSEAFRDMYHIKGIPWYNTSSFTTMYRMFWECGSLQTIPPLDTSKVTNMNHMFYACHKLTSIPQLNTSNVTDMNGMFNYCNISLTSIPQLNTSNVTDMVRMFEHCESLQTIPPLDTSKVTNMNRMFNFCNKLQRVEGIDFSSLTSSPRYFFADGTSSGSITTLTHFIVNGKIDWSWNDNNGFYGTPNLDYESIKSILEAMNRTTNTDSKTMTFNTTITDQNGELAGLVSSCATKGWTVTGLTIKK